MKRSLLLVIGWLSFLIGMIGVVLPILPTTPFLLLSAAFFAKSSKRCEAWLVSSKVYKRYVTPFKEQGGLTIKKKIEILLLVYTMLFISGCLVSHMHVRLVLLVVAFVKLIVLMKLPTARQGEMVS